MLRRLLLPLPLLPLLLLMLLLKRRCCGIRLLLPLLILQGDGAKKDMDMAVTYYNRSVVTRGGQGRELVRHLPVLPISAEMS